MGGAGGVMRTALMVETVSLLFCSLSFTVEMPQDKIPAHRLQEDLIIFVSYQTILHTWSYVSVLIYRQGNDAANMMASGGQNSQPLSGGRGVAGGVGVWRGKSSVLQAPKAMDGVGGVGRGVVGAGQGGLCGRLPPEQILQLKGAGQAPSERTWLSGNQQRLTTGLGWGGSCQSLCEMSHPV